LQPIDILSNKPLRKTEGQSKKDNLQTLPTLGKKTQKENK